MISIDGIKLPSPKSYDFSYMDIDKAERNARGDMIKERIATKRKIELEWGILNQSDMSKILQAVKSSLFSVTYFDPETGIDKTGTFYAGDRKAPIINFSGGKATYSGLKVNLIER